MSEAPQVPPSALENAPKVTQAPDQPSAAPQPASKHEQHAGLLGRLRGLFGGNPPPSKDVTAGYTPQGEYKVQTYGQQLDSLAKTLNPNTEKIEKPPETPPVAPKPEEENRELADLREAIRRAHTEEPMPTSNSSAPEATASTLDPMLDAARKAEETSAPPKPEENGPSTARKVGTLGAAGLAALGGLGATTGIIGHTEAVGASETTPAAVSEYNKPITTLESPYTTTFAVSPRGHVSGQKDTSQPEQTSDTTTPVQTETPNETKTEETPSTDTSKTTDTPTESSDNGTSTETAQQGAAFSSTNTDGNFKPADEVQPAQAEGGTTTPTGDNQEVGIGDAIEQSRGDTGPHAPTVDGQAAPAAPSEAQPAEAEKTPVSNVRDLVENPDASPYTVTHEDGSKDSWGTEIKGGDTTTSEVTLNADGKQMLEKFMQEKGITDPVVALKQMGVTDLAYGLPLPEDGDISRFDSTVKQTLVSQGEVSSYDAETGKITFSNNFPKSVTLEKAEQILGRPLTDTEKESGIVTACQSTEDVMLGEGAEVPNQIAGDTGILFLNFKRHDGTVVQARFRNSRTKCSFTIQQAPPQQETPPTPETPAQPAPPTFTEEAPPGQPAPPGLAVTGGNVAGKIEAGLGLVDAGLAAGVASNELKRRRERSDLKLTNDAAAGSPPDDDKLGSLAGNVPGTVNDRLGILGMQSERDLEKAVIGKEKLEPGNEDLDLRRGPQPEAKQEEVKEEAKEPEANKEEDPQLAELNKEIDSLSDELNRLNNNVAEAKGRLTRVKAMLLKTLALGKETSLHAKKAYSDSLVNEKNQADAEVVQFPSSGTQQSNQQAA